MTNALTGATLMEQRVTKGTRLLDVRPALVVAMGGGIGTNEVHLIDEAGCLSTGAFSLPFADAVHVETFRVLMVELGDETYLREPLAGQGKIIVEMVGAMTGIGLGQLKVTKETRLLDVRPALVGAMGGGIGNHEVYLTSQAGSVSKNAFSLPFANAVSGETYQVMMVELTDMVYLDHGDRRR